MQISTAPDAEQEPLAPLDELIPPSRPSARRLAVSALLVVGAAIFTFLNVEGWLYPRPTAGGSGTSSSLLRADVDRGLVEAIVLVPNYSGRDVRITDVGLDAPGARLVEVRLLLHEPTGDALVEAEDQPNEGSATVEAGVPIEEEWAKRDAAPLLPVVIPAGRRADLLLRFEPIECGAVEAPWGEVRVTVDFGDGAFPPFARTIEIDDAIYDGNDSGEIPVAVLAESGELIEADGPLVAACEALR